MKNNIDALLHHLLEGHCVMAKFHGDSPDAAYHRMVGIFEMEKRGVRFLPAQVVNRAVCKLMKHRKAKFKGIT